MDNRVNELRRKISILRLNMLDVEDSIRDQVNHDRDCTEAALRLMAMRQEMTALVGEWSLLGGSERLPTIQERLREHYRPLQKPKMAHRIAHKPAPGIAQKHRAAPKPKLKPEKRRLTARG